MSVAFFGAEELVNVARYLTSSEWSSDEFTEQVCRDLAQYSIANAWAFNRQYREDAAPVTYQEIAVPVRSDAPMFEPARARSTLGLLSYNAVTNAGNEYEGDAYAWALKRLMTAAHSRACEEIERLERKKLKG